ncbi:LacI family transcriptional regulator [Enterobacterales bacterium]|nr:LacI family transcriptional regulator [Enterobacterales bacterium]
MNGKLKIQQIADQTGLSISTVSRVLAGKSNTSSKARDKVLECAKSQGVLNGLSVGRLMLTNIMIFAPARAFDVRSDIFYYKVIQGVLATTARHEVRVRYCAMEEENADAALFIAKMSDPLTEAALLIGIDDPHIHQLATEMGKPCVLINCYDRHMRLDSVSPDHQTMGDFACDYLFSQGHTRIVTLQCLRRHTMELRLTGIRQAFSRHHQTFNDTEHLLNTSGFGAQESELALLNYLDALPEGQPLPTAILAGGDFMASGVMAALAQRGLSVPGDISLISTDGFNLAEIHDIPLTAVLVPRDELGTEAIALLQRRMLRPDAPFTTQLLQGKLVVRHSVRKSSGRKAVSHPHHLYDPQPDR